MTSSMPKTKFILILKVHFFYYAQNGLSFGIFSTLLPLNKFALMLKVALLPLKPKLRLLWYWNLAYFNSGQNCVFSMLEVGCFDDSQNWVSL